MEGSFIFLPNKFCFQLAAGEKVDFSLLKQASCRNFFKVHFNKSHAMIVFDNLRFQLYGSGKVGFIYFSSICDFVFLQDCLQEFWDNYLRLCVVRK